MRDRLPHEGMLSGYLHGKSQIPLRYPASEPSRELVREPVYDLLASWLQTCWRAASEPGSAISAR